MARTAKIDNDPSHTLGCGDPGGQQSPSLQGTHALLLEAPATGLNVPRSHGSGAVAPSGQKWPGPHSSLAVGVAQKWPFGHVFAAGLVPSWVVGNDSPPCGHPSPMSSPPPSSMQYSPGAQVTAGLAGLGQ